MSARNTPRFDIGALREYAGAKVYARGEAYFRDGQVRILAVEAERILAQVAGAEDYRTELIGKGRRIGGECSCPAFEDMPFCKHMVATALAANDARIDAEVGDAGAFARIRGHLKSKGVDALVDMIMDLAERDADLLNELDLASAVAQADDKTIEATLRKAIDNATQVRDFIDYREARSWAVAVDAVIDAVAGLASGEHASLELKLSERAIDRVGQAAGSIDDSDGHCGALLQPALDIHVAAARSARPDPVKLARDLFRRETEDDYDTFDGAASLHADLLGEQGLAEYRRLAEEAWQKLPTRSGAKHEYEAGYYQLRGILDFFLERGGGADALIALRAKDLSSPAHYLHLAEFCLSQGRDEEALRYAEEGLWMFEDDRADARLVFFAVELPSKAGRKGDTKAHLWQALKHAPSLDLYVQLCTFGGRAVPERAVTFLEARLVKEKPTYWHRPADLLINILLHERMFDAAWLVLRAHKASTGIREALALASEASHPREALDVYTARVERLISSGVGSSCEEAVKLIDRMGALRSAAEQAAYDVTLKARFARRRNLMKLLG